MQLIIGIPPMAVGVYGGGNSSGPIGGTVTTCWSGAVGWAPVAIKKSMIDKSSIGAQEPFMGSQKCLEVQAHIPRLRV